MNDCKEITPAVYLYDLTYPPDHISHPAMLFLLKEIRAQQIKHFLRFSLSTWRPQLHPCDQMGHGHVCCGLREVSLLCAKHWTLTLLIPVTVQHVGEKRLRKLSRLTVTCAWPKVSLHFNLNCAFSKSRSNTVNNFYHQIWMFKFLSQVFRFTE